MFKHKTKRWKIVFLVWISLMLQIQSINSIHGKYTCIRLSELETNVFKPPKSPLQSPQHQNGNESKNVLNSIEKLRCYIRNNNICCPLNKTKRIKRRGKRESIWHIFGRHSHHHNNDHRHESLTSRLFGKLLKSDNFLTKFFGFKDSKTELNCPPEFYKEHEKYSSTEFHPQPYIPHSSSSDYHDNDNFYHHYVGSSEESDDVPNINYDSKILNHPHHIAHNRPIIFPDDKRYIHLTSKTPFILQPTPIVTENRISGINTPKCGIAIGERLIGGVSSNRGQFSWTARIAYINKTSNSVSYRCSGSVIAKFYILTAAHCVVNLVKDLELSYIRIGDDDSESTFMDKPLYRIINIIVHPNYDKPKYASDIALLQFEPVQSNTPQIYSTICLPLNSSTEIGDLLIGTKGIVAGWSTTKQDSETTTNSKVKYLQIPVVNTTECAITYAQYSENFDDQIVITPSQLCAQGQPMNDVCRGDSGGPFMDDGSSGLFNSNGQFTLIGIVSFGPTICGVTNFPGVYTRVSSFVNWIIANIR